MEGDYEAALFMAYATVQSSEPMNSIVISDFDMLINVLNLQVLYAIDWDDPPASAAVDVLNMSGTVYFVKLSTNVYTITSNTIALQNSSISGVGTCTGTMKIVDSQYDTASHLFKTITVSIPTLKTTYSDSDYETATFSGWQFIKDSTGTYPEYTISGSVKVDNTGYGYTDFMYADTAADALSVSGKFSLGNLLFSITGTPTLEDGTNDWISGTLTLQQLDNDENVLETATVTLDGTTATFAITDGDTWDKEDWATDRLVP